jgi:hypothetical protein
MLRYRHGIDVSGFTAPHGAGSDFIRVVTEAYMSKDERTALLYEPRINGRHSVNANRILEFIFEDHIVDLAN